MSGLFIGISVDPDQAVACLDSARQIWSRHPYIRWFSPESLHCTLADVEIETKQFHCVARTMMQGVMERVSLAYQQFSTTVNQFAWFGSKKILVLTNPQGNTNLKLAQLSRTLIRRLRGQRLKVTQGQPFCAHVSLGERDMAETVVDIHSSIYNPPPTQQLVLRLNVNNLSLYRVIAHRQYEIVYTVELKTPKQACELAMG